MNFTQDQINWYNQAVNSGQYTPEAAMAALQAAMQPQPPMQMQPQMVEQPQQPLQGMPSQQSVTVNQAGPNMLAMFSAIADTAAIDEDHAAIMSGKPPRAGTAWIRIKGYIEIGVHQGKNTTYAPKPICLVILELNHPDHMKTFDGVQEPTELTIRVSKTHSQNSKFPKFFKALARALGNHPQTGAPISHLSQAIGMGCLGEVYHNKSDDKVYANLDLEGAWSFKPSNYNDPGTGQPMSVNIPPLAGEPLLFMMDNQEVNKHPEMVKQMWDSIYIPGERTSKDAAGNDKVTSNNYYQELIAKGLNWGTSETKRILASLGCVTEFGASNEAQSNNMANGTPALAAAPQQAAMQAPVQQHMLNAPVQNNAAAMHNTNMQPAMVQQAPAQQPAYAAPQQAVPQQPYEAAPQGGVPQPVQQAAQYAQPAAPVAQPSVGAPTGAAMSAADFMNQFNQ